MKNTIFYRGEHGHTDNLVHTRLPSISFGSLTAAKRYATHPNHSTDTVHQPRILSAYLDIVNPIFNQPDDPFIDLDRLEELLGTQTTVELFIRHFDTIRNTNSWESLSPEDTSDWQSITQRLSCLIYPLLDDPWFIEQCRCRGYDGAFYRGSGETRDEMEVRVFDVKQIVLIDVY